MRSGNSNNFRKIKCAAVLTAAVFILPSCKGLELENKTEQVYALNDKNMPVACL